MLVTLEIDTLISLSPAARNELLQLDPLLDQLFAAYPSPSLPAAAGGEVVPEYATTGMLGAVTPEPMSAKMASTDLANDPRTGLAQGAQVFNQQAGMGIPSHVQPQQVVQPQQQVVQPQQQVVQPQQPQQPQQQVVQPQQPQQQVPQQQVPQQQVPQDPDALRAAMQQSAEFIASKDVGQLSAVLQQFGIASLPECPAEQLPAFVNSLQQVASQLSAG